MEISDSPGHLMLLKLLQREEDLSNRRISGKETRLDTLRREMKLFRYWKVYGQILRKKTDNRGITRCIQELRMKGVCFDLSKEPRNGKRIRMKSSSVEIKWKPATWCSRYFITVGLVLASALVLPLCKLMICS
ncbi:hypothetical protein L1987_40277 [Smallanthus sonchifolius]|uniref:Uncharacterized protein n=1 Tax=Smallanthus sonchifolius TaxID=185202 RepID=A0ACB9GTW9_9ASTR|nr:hypothetical protein L1987_40277 [Smallanthus sonchifolius]